MQRIEYDTHITQRTRHGVLPKILVECIRKGSFTYDVWWKMGWLWCILIWKECNQLVRKKWKQRNKYISWNVTLEYRFHKILLLQNAVFRRPSSYECSLNFYRLWNLRYSYIHKFICYYRNLYKFYARNLKFEDDIALSYPIYLFGNSFYWNMMPLVIIKSHGFLFVFRYLSNSCV